MRLWLSKSSAVPLREQLATQIMLGIVSGDLTEGQRLPSTREIARRFHIHSNTVSAVYRELSARGWVEFRKGSGVYVCGTGELPAHGIRLELDQLITSFLQSARSNGFSLTEVQARLKQWLELQPPDRFLVIEPDAELRAILVAEIEAATGFRVSGTDPNGCAQASVLTGAVCVAMFGQAKAARSSLPHGTSLVVLRSRSVPESLRGAEPPPPDALIALVSRWPEFLKWSRTILVSAGVDSGSLSFHDARERGWRKGLSSSTFVITDALTAQSLPVGLRSRIFHMIADSSIEELRLYVERFLAEQPSSIA